MENKPILNLEFDKCCHNLLDDPEKAVNQIQALQGHLTAIVTAFDESQSGNLFVSLEGFEKLHKVIEEYKKDDNFKTE